jgi:hypothetical protein
MQDICIIVSMDEWVLFLRSVFEVRGRDVRLDLVWQMIEERLRLRVRSSRTNVPIVSRTQRSHSTCILQTHLKRIPDANVAMRSCIEGCMSISSPLLCAKRVSPKVLSRSPDTSLVRAQQVPWSCTSYSATNHSWQPSNHLNRLSELVTCNNILDNFVK